VTTRGRRSNRYHHLHWLGGVSVFQAELAGQSFARHAHEGFAIGAISTGVGGYFCRGENRVLPRGSLSLMNPEEAHTGGAHSAVLRYDMLYVTEASVKAHLDLAHLQGFPAVTAADPGLVVGRALRALAGALNAPKGPDWRLAIEQGLQAALASAFERHASARCRPAGREPAAIERVREAIRAGVEAGGTLSLAALARIAGLHPSYLVRSFSRATGLSPHAYALSLRVARARDLILQGSGGAEAALAAGFCDQSHMLRQMRRRLGVTPADIRVHRGS